MTSPVPSESSTFHNPHHAMHDVYEKAKTRGAALQRKRWVRIVFEVSAYTLLLLVIYFGLIGMPLWKGGVWWLYWVVSNKFVIQGGWAILIGLAFLYDHPDDFPNARVMIGDLLTLSPQIRVLPSSYSLREGSSLFRYSEQ